MTEEPSTAHLKAILSFSSVIQAETGLHIGGTDTGLSIGGADDTVVRNGQTNEPYIPGSSLRGRMRSLLDRVNNLSLNQVIRDDEHRSGQVKVHLCETQEAFDECQICQMFGVTGNEEDEFVSEPTRLIVSDAALTEDSREQLTDHPGLDMPMTEVKTEVAIDRLTSSAVPRQRERVPASTEFRGSFSLQLFETPNRDDLDQAEELVATLAQGLFLVEQTYLGGEGSRGYGRVEFNDLSCSVDTFVEDAERPSLLETLDESTWSNAREFYEDVSEE